MIHETAVIYPGTVIGEGVEIQAGAVLGKPPKLAKGSTAAGGALEPLVIGAGAVICCQAIVCAGTRLGEHMIVGDLAHDPRGHAHRDRARGHVACDDGAGGDERLLADLDPRAESHTAADPAGPA